MKQILPIISLFLFTFFSISAQTTIYDFETEASSAVFTYFGSGTDLNDTNTSVIENPDASGINTSSMVTEYIKPSPSEVWAGAFANPGPVVDLTSSSQVCIDVWFPAPGNVALKLEAGDLPNWILTVDVTETQTWTNICFDVLTPSIEDPFQPAAGGIFNGLVLFFDFGTVLTAQQTYYFDNVTIDGGSAEPGDVTFSVDMNEYEGDFNTVFVSGDFNEFSGTADPLSDDDGDGVWTGTVTGVEPGAQTYRYTLDNWSAQEAFNGTEECTVLDASGDFYNRTMIVTGDIELPTTCFESCYACGEGINITINLGEAGIIVDEAGLFIAGGGNFGNPGDYPLVANGDGTHSITITRQAGFESFYTFTNGACPDYSCKESIVNQDCANPDNFNDRFMGPFTEDAVINTCFGICSESTECEAPPGNMVTLEVDMNDYAEDFTTAYVSGTFNNWAGDANPLSDDDGDGIWSITIELPNGDYQYKFQLDAWMAEEILTDGGSCTVADGLFVNRALNSIAGDSSICAKWNTCIDCDGNSIGISSGINDLTISNSIFTIQPTLAHTETIVYFKEQNNDSVELQVYNAYGQLIQNEKIASTGNQHTLNVSHLNNGLYFVNIETAGERQTQRIIVHH